MAKKVYLDDGQIEYISLTEEDKASFIEVYKDKDLYNSHSQFTADTYLRKMLNNFSASNAQKLTSNGLAVIARYKSTGKIAGFCINVLWNEDNWFKLEIRKRKIYPYPGFLKSIFKSGGSAIYMQELFVLPNSHERGIIKKLIEATIVMGQRMKLGDNPQGPNPISHLLPTMNCPQAVVGDFDNPQTMCIANSLQFNRRYLGRIDRIESDIILSYKML